MTANHAGDSPSMEEKPSASFDNHDNSGAQKSDLPHRDDDDVDFSMVNEKATLRKMDIRLIPMLALLYLLSFLDRGNIGNAKIQGLVKDLDLKSNEYNLCLTGMLTNLGHVWLSKWLSLT
jgi:hypothetical protein